MLRFLKHDTVNMSYVNLDPPPPPPPKGCFPSVVTVETENGRSVAMSELQTGSKVKTGFIITIFISFQIKE